MGLSEDSDLWNNKKEILQNGKILGNDYVNNNGPILNSISKFYENTNIFVTGATGFLGKALVEKLLRSCSGIDSISLLMRPKREKTSEQRRKDLFEDPVFNRIREENPGAFSKVKVISGDVALPDLGINEDDRHFLVEHIDIVFHSAATIRFDEDLKTAVTINTLGTKRLLQICKTIKNLKSFIHVSTAYSNCDKQTVEEAVYKPIFDPDSIINDMDMLPQEVINLLEKKILEIHPNTYTFTKGLAEQLVSESSNYIPAAIVRPSIITAAWKEPYPGWVGSRTGITGLFLESGRGAIKSVLCDDECTADLIPVDLVVNTIITAAWHTVVSRSNNMRVYNCTSGSTNPITWRMFEEFGRKYWLEYPSRYVTWYPGYTNRINRVLHNLCVVLFHIIPSMILDSYLYVTNRKPIMLKISQKVHKVLESFVFFTTHQWDFKTSTMQSLIEAISYAQDGEHFQVDQGKPNSFNWDLYMKAYTIGARKYVLKDEMNSLPRARAKLNRLYWIQKMLQTILFIIALIPLIKYIIR